MQIQSISVYNQYQNNQFRIQKSMEKLSSGQRINRASDDSAGLSISEKMRSQIRGMNQMVRNIEDGKSVLELADNTLDISQDMLHRLSELAIQGSSNTLSDNDRKAMGEEINSLLEQMDVMYQSTKFNGKKLFDGNGDFMIPVSSDGQGSYINISYMAMDGLKGTSANGTEILSLEDFKIGEKQQIESRESMENLASVVKSAVNQVSKERGYIGAKYNALEFSEEILNVQNVNLQSTESRIRDVDVAKEMMNLTKNQILQQATSAMIAQANQMPQQVLQLLR